MKNLKKMMLAFCAGCVLAGCAGRTDSYLIEGEWAGGDGERVYLKKVIGDRQYETVDSAVVENGRFRMSRPLEDVDERIVQTGSVQTYIVLDEVPVSVVCTDLGRRGKKGRMSVQVSGSVEQDIFKCMLDAQRDEMLAMLGISFMGEKAAGDKALQDSIGRMYLAAKAKTGHILDSLVANYRDSYAVALIINNLLARQRSADEVEGMYAGLTPRIKASYPGRKLKATLDRMKTTEEGGMAPDFTLSGPEGREVRLSDFRGKFLLLDFWASWCGPCMKEIPGLKDVYAEYHEKGFEILSVSLDDKLEKWTEAIKRLDMGWVHASSLKGWKCPVAKMYSVTGIPAMFLLDRDGKILACGLRGEKLRERLESLLE